MKKIILNADLILNASHRTKGLKSEELLIQQDAVGGHQVSLAIGNEGIIEVGKQPNCVTSLVYRVDDEKVYWTSEILTPQLVIKEPGKITDLVVYLVDSNGAKIRWTAPSGNPPVLETAATRYHIYLSQSEIDSNYGLTDLPEYHQHLVPKAPGTAEELVLTSLLPGHKYYVAIISETVIFGKSKFSMASNVVSFLAANNDIRDIAPKIIPINPERMYPQGLNYAIDPETNKPLIPANLADLSGIINRDGEPEGTPNAGMGILMYGLGAIPQYNRPSWDTIIDLEGSWNLEYLYVWVVRNGEIEIQSSIDGVNFDAIASINASVNQGKWAKILVNPIYSQGIKYINIAFKKSEHGIKGLLFYGKRAESGQVKGKKHKRTVTSRTFDERMGTNGFMIEKPEMVRRIARSLRCYVESDWIVGRQNSTQGAAYDENGQVILGVNDVKFQFQRKQVWNWDEKLAAFNATGQKVMLSTNNAPLYLRPKGYSRADQAKPVDPGLDPVNLGITTNPLSYKHIARLAYNIAARYGANLAADRSFIQLSAEDEVKTGLNLIESIEFRNEADAYWTGENGYHNWEEQAAILSAVYDGHKGALGAGFGVKAADPNLRVSMSSLAVGNNVGFVKRMTLWWDLHRGYGDYPIDIINFHHYNGSAGSQTVPVYSDVPSSGVPPEQSEFLELVHSWNEFRDSQLPKVELRLTEVGYDEHWGGVYSPDYREQSVRSRYKGYWLTRTFLLGIAKGLDIINQYWFANTEHRLADLDPNVKYRDVFITAGLTEGERSPQDTNRVPLPAFWYVSNLMSELSGYTYQFPLRMFGETAANGLTFDTVDPNLIALVFKNDAGETIIVAWLGSVGFRQKEFKLYLHPSENQVSFVTLNDAEIRKSVTGGLQTMLNANADEAGKYVTVALTECPAIIKTKNTGTKRLSDPEGLKIEAISNSVVKLAWKDSNIGSNITKVFVSSLPDRDFTQLYSGYIDNGEYIVENLAEGRNYFFKIQFEHGGLTSDLSETLGITTLATLTPPANLRVTSKSTTRVTLEWDYTVEEQQKIDEFELSSSLTANGVYTVIAKIPKALRSYVVDGLTPNTGYFFKMRVRKDFGFSDYTLRLGETTNTESEKAPELLSAKSNYAGDRIKMVFDRALANPAGQHAGFSVIETNSGSSSYISPERCTLDPLNSSVLYLYLGSLIKQPNSILTISYDKLLANIQSTNNIKANSFTAFPVANNKNNAGLLSKKICINFTNAITLANQDSANGEVWNNMIFPNSDSSTFGADDNQKYQKNLKTSSGAVSSIDYIGPYRPLDQIGQGPGAEADMLQVDDVNFPQIVASTGIRIGEAEYNIISQSMFMNLDRNKDYNIRLLFNTDKYHTDPRNVDYKDWQGTVFKSIVIPGASSVYLTSLRPVTASIPVHDAVGGYPEIDHMSDPKTGAIYQRHSVGTYLCGIILEEVLPE